MPLCHKRPAHQSAIQPIKVSSLPKKTLRRLSQSLWGLVSGVILSISPLAWADSTTIASASQLKQACATGEFRMLSNPNRYVQIMKGMRTVDGGLSIVECKIFEIAREEGVPDVDTAISVTEIGPDNLNDWIANISQSPKRSFFALTGHKSLSTDNFLKIVESLYILDDIDSWLSTPNGGKPSAEQLQSYRQIKQAEKERVITYAQSLQKEKPEVFNRWIEEANRFLRGAIPTTRETLRRGLVQTRFVAELALGEKSKDRITAATAIAECALLQGGTAYLIKFSASNKALVITKQESVKYKYEQAYHLLMSDGLQDDFLSALPKAIAAKAPASRKAAVQERLATYYQEVGIALKEKIAQLDKENAQLDKENAQLDKENAQLDKDIDTYRRLTKILNAFNETLSVIPEKRPVNVSALNQTISDFNEFIAEFKKLPDDMPIKQELQDRVTGTIRKVESLRPLFEKQRLKVLPISSWQ